MNDQLNQVKAKFGVLIVELQYFVFRESKRFHLSFAYRTGCAFMIGREKSDFSNHCAFLADRDLYVRQPNRTLTQEI